MAPLDAVTREQFDAFRDIRYGQANGERMENPFWLAMVDSGLDAYFAKEHFVPREPGQSRERRPVWSFQRFGMSRTMLPDHSIVFIAGEHEDGYDPDFAIYNDVIVRRWDGRTRIYGYPPGDFPPTDFHTATLVGEEIYIVGRVGLRDDRIYGTTPVYRLELDTMNIHGVEVPGEEPGWIGRHEAIYLADENAILIWGGTVVKSDDEFVAKEEMWAFSLDERRWHRVESIRLRTAPDPWWIQ